MSGMDIYPEDTGRLRLLMAEDSEGIYRAWKPQLYKCWLVSGTSL
jgi:hypothetical protein